jgi:ParB family chromosome partitioning protein
MAKPKGLGRGLGALIKEAPAGSPDAPEGVRELPLAEISPSPWQPRHAFDPDALQELAQSIRERGVVQPLLVRQNDGAYELIAGERRFRAAQQAGLNTVPVLLVEASDQEVLEIALVENLQREDLNPIDEAEGFQVLAQQFRLTQDQVAQRVGKARASVANALRLLELSESIRGMVAAGAVSAGHAKVLLQVEEPADREILARRVVKEHLSVRALENLVQKTDRSRKKKRRADNTGVPAQHLTQLADTLQRHFGTSVRIDPCRTLNNGKKTKGTVAIDYYSAEELDRLLEMFGLTEDL